MQTKKRPADIVYQCQYYVVFTTFWRKKLLTDGAEKALRDLIIEICLELEIAVIELQIYPDQVHLHLLSQRPKPSIYQIIDSIKHKTSGVMREEFQWLRTRVPTLWTRNHFVTTLGSLPKDDLEQFLQRQTREYQNPRGA